MPEVINAGDKAVSTNVEGSSLSASSIDMTDFKEIKSQQTQADSTKPPIEGLSTDDELLKQMFSIGLPQNKELSQALNQVLEADKQAKTPQEATTAEEQAMNDYNAEDNRIASRENLGDVALKIGSPSLALAAYEDALKTQVDSPVKSPEVGADLLAKLDKLGISKEQAYSDVGIQTVLGPSDLDPNDSVLRETFKDGAPTQPQEQYAFQSIVLTDRNMQAVQLAVATGQTDGTDITDQLGGAAELQISSRIDLGDICALNGDNKDAVGSYLSALKMQLNNAFSANDDGNAIYDKLEKLGMSRADAIKAVVGDAEAPGQ